MALLSLNNCFISHQEPIAFLGGFVSGILRLDVKEDPLREWVERTADAAGLKDVDEEDMEEDSPQEIQIE